MLESLFRYNNNDNDADNDDDDDNDDVTLYQSIMILSISQIDHVIV